MFRINYAIDPMYGWRSTDSGEPADSWSQRPGFAHAKPAESRDEYALRVFSSERFRIVTTRAGAVVVRNGEAWYVVTLATRYSDSDRTDALEQWRDGQGRTLRDALANV